MKKKESVNFLSREVQMDCKKRRRTLGKNKDLATANEESSIDSYNTLARHMVEPSSSRSGNRKKGLEPLCEDVYISVKSPFNCPVPEEDDTAYKYWLDYVYVPEEDEEDDGDSLLVNVAEEPLTGDVAEDPQYKLFLDHVKVRGTCYAIEIPEQNLYIEYPDVALTVAYEAQNNVGKDSHAVSAKAQNNVGEYSGNRRGRKPKYLGQMVKDTHDVSPEAQNHVGDHIHPPSGIEIKVKEEIEEDDDDSLCKRRRKVPSLNLEHYWHDDKANAMKYTKYREKLMQELEKPYCEEEYKRLFKYMKHKKLVEYHKEHRSGSRTCKRNYLGKSLLNHHVDLNKKLKSVSGDYPKRLTRGFVFWLMHCADDEAFKPWIYPEYCKPAPKV